MLYDTCISRKALLKRYGTNSYYYTDFALLRTGHHRGMKFDRDDRRTYRNCDNCLETELTPVHIFDCPIIRAALQERNKGLLFINKSLCGQY
ncbi:uncharacterized protein TNCV_4215441 [Trichonephila clavipes]|nr:uncharacterized protein TNCV_4215441 [Trichonephila clavipes]